MAVKKKPITFYAHLICYRTLQPPMILLENTVIMYGDPESYYTGGSEE